MRALPNALTLLRLLLAPLLALCFLLLPDGWRNEVATVLFLFAGVTDFLDGYFARRYNTGSIFGACLDPIADKIIIITALLILLVDDRAHFVAVYIIVMREIVVSFLREWMAGMGKHKVLKVSNWGKVKTFFQMLALAVLLFGRDIGGYPLLAVGEICLWVAVVLALWSMFSYCLAIYLDMKASQ